jgi:hypothetical protein
MGIGAVVTRLFRRGTPGFTDFESKALSALSEVLSPSEMDRLRERVKRINLVQRLDGGREVNAFAMRGGKPVLDEDTRIDSSIGERALARIAIEGPAGTANTAQVWLVDGNLFSIEFDEPTEHADASAVLSIRVTRESGAARSI